MAYRLPNFLLISSFVILLYFLAGCGGSSSNSEGSTPTQLRFTARINGQDVQCGVQYEGVGRTAETVQVQDFRFFISNLTLITSSGAEVPVSLIEDGLWQFGDVALLDFEDATGACAELGTTLTNNVVNFTVPAGDYVAARFTLGVPFEQNHLDTASASAPLNLGAMQWNWQAGYKFIRVDLLNGSTAAPNNRWFIHLGSTGCESESRVTPPTTECSRPNRVEVTLENFNPDTGIVVVDAGEFLANTDVSFNTPDTLPGCMSTPTDPECPGVFRALGLSLETGQSLSDCDNCQELFRIE